MRKFKRLDPPEFLAAKWEQWGKEWQTRHTENKSAAFNWREVDGKRVNQLLLPKLKEQVQNHCSFCDNYPVSPPSPDTIEHFKPKTKFHLEAYKWENLYYCCGFCQGKSSNYDEAALRPDDSEYSFDKYFRWDYTLGTLEINETASPEDQHRARVTRDLYRLNESHPKLRRRELYRRSRMQDLPLDDFAYRDYAGSGSMGQVD